MGSTWRLITQLMKFCGVFSLIKVKSRRYPVQTITDACYADDNALLTNTPAQAESLLHNLEKAAGGIGLYDNADKTEYMWFNQNQTRDISTQTGSFLKLVEKFTCFSVA